MEGMLFISSSGRLKISILHKIHDSQIANIDNDQKYLLLCAFCFSRRNTISRPGRAAAVPTISIAVASKPLPNPRQRVRPQLAQPTVLKQSSRVVVYDIQQPAVLREARAADDQVALVGHVLFHFQERVGGACGVGCEGFLPGLGGGRRWFHAPAEVEGCC